MVSSAECPPKNTDQGFWVGSAVSIALSLVMKLVGCSIQQVGIGGFMGKSMLVRQTACVHKVQIRCIEYVLRQKGFTMGKVAILCGGPDWPTSVLAGILKLPLIEMLVGTLPIIFFIIPCALTGSFYLKSNDPTSMLASASSLMALASLIVTGVLWAISAWAVQQALEEHPEEVTRPLVENVHLEWLDYRSEYVRKKLKTTWSSISPGVRLVWTFGVLTQIFVCHCFQWLFTSLVGKFAVSDSIDTLTFIAGFNAEDGLFTYQSLALIGVYAFAWSGHVVYCIWKRRALGPGRLAALKECDEMEAKWKEEYIKMCKLKAPTDAGAAGDAKVADSRETEVDADDEVVGGYSVHV
uniref:Uncharacterized protein n=1 Tax=Alexandrium catenella TaxID=2925 RepID=A0A7S1S641_ALECA